MISAMHFGVLSHRRFAILAFGQTVSNIGTWMSFVAVAWSIYQLTDSAFQLGMVAIVRTVPFVLFSLLGGSVADRHDRRKILLITQSAAAAISAVLAAAFLVHLPTDVLVLLIYLMTGALGIVTAFDAPSMTSSVPALVPREDLVSAVGLFTLSRQFGSVTGPSIAGLLIGIWGAGAAFACDAVSYLVVVAVVASIRWASEPDGPRLPVAKAIGEGLRYSWNTPVILGVFLFDFFATLFAQPVGLLPIFARDVLHVGAQGYGVLSSAYPAGAVIGGLAITAIRGRLQPTIRNIVLSTTLFGSGLVVFGFSAWFPLSMAALAVMGIGDVISETFRSTLIQLTVPDELRGRVSSLMLLFVRGGPGLGQARAGAFADWFGPVFSAVSGGVLCVAATFALAGWTTSRIRSHASRTPVVIGGTVTERVPAER